MRVETRVVDVDDLYALPLEEFTMARNALAKRLAKDGDKSGAAEVKTLVKPAKTAWALNQLARRRPEVVSGLIEAGDRLRAAQQQALDGDAAGLRDATRAEQEQVGAAADAALAVMGGRDDGAMAERLRRTLRAAATDPSVGAVLRAGRLTADVESSGFGLEGLSPEAPPRDVEADRARLQEQRDAVRDAERLAKKAEAARERADRFAEEATRAEHRAVEARETADDAEEIAQEAEAAAAAAAQAVTKLG